MMSTFDALADPTRRDTLDPLRERPRSVGELVGILSKSQPDVSQHQRVLRQAGWVSVQQDARRRWYTLRPDRLAENGTWLVPYRELWRARLNALERYLSATKE